MFDMFSWKGTETVIIKILNVKSTHWLINWENEFGLNCEKMWAYNHNVLNRRKQKVRRWNVCLPRLLKLFGTLYLICVPVCVAAWPRYRVLPVQELGQYNLEILSADLSDDSLYECQAPDAALRSRRAKLTVLSTFVCQSSSPSNVLWEVLCSHTLPSHSSPTRRPGDRWGSGGAAECGRVLQLELCVSRG